MAKKSKKRRPEIRADTGIQSEVMVADEILLSALIGRSSVTREMALQIPTVRGCISKIANVISSIPIRLYKKGEDGRPEEVLEDKRVILLNDDTGDTLTATQFWRAMLEDYFVGKGGYAYICREKGGYRSLHYVEGRNISFLYNNDPIFKDYEILVNGSSYKPYEFLKILRNTKDGMKSASISEENPLLIGLAYASLIYEDNLVRKGGNKRGFLQSERNLTQPQMDNLKEAYKRLYSNNSENVVVLNNGVKFQEASNTSVEMQLNENKTTNAQEICKLLGVPTGILTGQATDNDREIFTQTCVDIMTDIECSLDRDFLMEKEKGNYYWAFDTRELMRGNIKERYEAYRIGLEKNFLQVDEVRQKEDLPPLGFEWITLGLDSVLYNPKTGEMYTPNTNAVQQMQQLKMPEERAASKIVVVTGPPCSGKTTYVEEHMTENDVAYDFDKIVRAITTKKDHSAKMPVGLDVAEAIRWAFLKKSAKSNEIDTVFMITVNQTQRLKKVLEKLDLEVKYVKMELSKEECLDRLQKDENRPDKEAWAKIIEKYFDEKEGDVE